MQGWERVTCVAIVPCTLLVGNEASRAAQGFRGGDQVGHQMQPLPPEKLNLLDGTGILGEGFTQTPRHYRGVREALHMIYP